MDYVIVGNSAASVGAIESIREYDKENRITVISDEPYHVYSRPLISYYLGGKVNEDKVSYRENNFYEKNNVKAVLGTKIVKVDTNEKCAIAQDGTKYPYDRLLIATGGKPFVPPIKGLDKDNFHTFVSLDDAKKLKETAVKGSKAVVIGGGLIGFKAAEGLNDLGVEVTVVELADRVLSAILDKESGDIVKNRLEHFGINIMTNNTVTDILGVSKINEVVLKDGAHIKCGNLIIAIGVTPNIDIVKDTDIKVNRGIITDEHMMTSVKDVYAAGDVAEGKEFFTGGNRVVPIWPNAYMQGETAGANMAGKNVRYDGSIVMNSIGFKDIHIITAGLVNPSKDGAEVLVKTDGVTKYKKIIIEDEKIVGFINIGDIERSGIYTNLIRERVDISEFKNKLLEEDFGYVYMPKSYRKSKILGQEANI